MQCNEDVLTYTASPTRLTPLNMRVSSFLATLQSETGHHGAKKLRYDSWQEYRRLRVGRCRCWQLARMESAKLWAELWERLPQLKLTVAITGPRVRGQGSTPSASGYCRGGSRASRGLSRYAVDATQRNGNQHTRLDRIRDRIRRVKFALVRAMTIVA